MAEVEDVFRRMKLPPEMIHNVMQYVRSGAGFERQYHKQRMESLYKELTNTKTNWLEGKITEEEHNDKRKSLVERRDLITVEIQQHNQADDKFSERLMDVVKIGGNAYDHFRLSHTEGKRRLVNLVFSTVKLRGRNVEFSLRSPFDTFVKAENIEQWRRGGLPNLYPH